MNGIKKNLIVPDFLIYANVTSIYKQKGDKSDLENDRGIFNLVTIRSILDKLIYNDKYEMIDATMSDSNIGARKRRNIRDHLWIVNGIINDINHGKGPATDFQIYDITKCFDSMWYKETMNDLYDASLTDDKFYLLSELNKKSKVSLKMPVGNIDREEYNQIIQQGSVWGPLQ